MSDKRGEREPQAFPERMDAGYDRSGMSLRDYFAAAALRGMLAGGKFYLFGDDGESFNAELAATNSYELADAMLKERAK